MPYGALDGALLMLLRGSGTRYDGDVVERYAMFMLRDTPYVRCLMLLLSHDAFFSLFRHAFLPFMLRRDCH